MLIHTSPYNLPEKLDPSKLTFSDSIMLYFQLETLTYKVWRIPYDCIAPHDYEKIKMKFLYLEDLNYMLAYYLNFIFPMHFPYNFKSYYNHYGITYVGINCQHCHI